jgi:hypothetical protein
MGVAEDGSPTHLMKMLANHEELPFSMNLEGNAPLKMTLRTPAQRCKRPERPSYPPDVTDTAFPEKHSSCSLSHVFPPSSYPFYMRELTCACGSKGRRKRSYPYVLDCYAPFTSCLSNLHALKLLYSLCEKQLLHFYDFSNWDESVLAAMHQIMRRLFLESCKLMDYSLTFALLFSTNLVSLTHNLFSHLILLHRNTLKSYFV